MARLQSGLLYILSAYNSLADITLFTLLKYLFIIFNIQYLYHHNSIYKDFYNN